MNPEMPAALSRLGQTLEGEGLYLAKVTYKLVRHADIRQIDIHVNVDPGPRARAGTLQVVNHTPFPLERLRSRLKLKPKTQVTSETLAKSTDRERKCLTKQGYLGARVSMMRGAYDAAKNEVPLRSTSPRD